MNKFTSLIASLSLLGLITASAASANSFQNGDFATNTGNGQVSVTTTVAGWYIPAGGYSFLFANGTEDHGAGAVGQYGSLYLWTNNNGGNSAIGTPPSGAGQFIAIDGAFQQQPLNQDITGLHIGKTYTVGFDYGYSQQFAFDGDTIQRLDVSLGNSAVQSTPQLTNPNHNFTGWYHDSMSFVADSTSETLSFLAYGNLPVPPFALVAGVTFTPDGVPEPSAWMMTILGVAALGAAARRRRTQVSPLAA